MPKKRILLGLPKHFSLYKSIKTNIEFHNYEVIDICCEDNHNFKYKHIGQKTYNFLRKTFLNDKSYKNKIKFYEVNQRNVKILEEIEGKVDYALLIRPDVYPLEFVQKIKKKSEKLLAYQWDGLSRFPAIYSYIELFDRFFVFDKVDLDYKKSKLLPITNFYCDYNNFKISKEIHENDVFFIGSLIPKRMPQIELFIENTRKLNLKLDINIYYISESHKDKYPIKGIKYIDKYLTYEENINQLKKSRIVIDFLNETHKGLSFRTFEAICFDKKLITNNPEVKKYDFYNPNNIFIWDGKNLDGLEEFILSPYIKLNEEVKLKYGFKNWLNYVMDEGEYIPIELPE